MPAGTVEVFLIGAVGIKDTEIFGKADPYAILFCGKQKLRSNTASNQGSKPVWNQKFSFYVDDNATDLQLKVYNHNILKDDDELGSTIIPLTKVFAENKLPTTSYNVVRPSGRVQGEIKLSLSFTPKNKPGQQVPLNISGPYNAKIHGSPYAATPPEPKVKHDPLIGPHGYYRSSSGKSSTTGLSHGNNTNSLSSDSGSSRPYAISGMDAYPPKIYPPVPPVNVSQAPYHHTQSNQSFHDTDSISSSDGSSHGRLYPAPAEYNDTVYNQSPYGHSSSVPSHHSEASHHGVVPAAPPGYPQPAGQNPSYASSPRPKPSHGGGNQYGRFDDLAGRFGALNVSGSDSESSHHGTYPGYPSSQSFSNDRPPIGYPPMESGSNYHGYPPPNGRPGGGYPPLGPPPGPPPGYPSAGYPPQFDSGHGSFSQSGYEAPPPSFYPPHLGVPQQPYARPGDSPSSNAYPPSPYYNAPSQHYVPAGYPK